MKVTSGVDLLAVDLLSLPSTDPLTQTNCHCSCGLCGREGELGEWKKSLPKGARQTDNTCREPITRRLKELHDRLGAAVAYGRTDGDGGGSVG